MISKLNQDFKAEREETNMSKLLKAGTYKVEIEITIDEDVEESVLDNLFEEAMYNNYDCTIIESSDIGEYIPVEAEDKKTIM